ncbi:erythrocyte band 7 integral membrane protein isoform X2 [Mus pahari]|uniref:erythrocyte band 7 integral membrane protein isoform X2 n=1 Tax=Mus pahari TaxID=10093 RepID=UPI001114DC0C|nr:erythrocyte band 7 integral membrane protein isoform X2 [Mus pahari]
MSDKRHTSHVQSQRIPESFRENSKTDLGACGWILVAASFFFVVITFPISVWICIKIVKEYERVIIFRLGRILQGGAKGPGLFFILPCTDSLIKVDMRTISFDIPPQEVLTKDSVTISVDGVVYYRVQNATLAVANITNADSATRLLAQTTLRNALGTKNLSQILSDKTEACWLVNSERRRWLAYAQFSYSVRLHLHSEVVEANFRLPLTRSEP